MDEDDFEEYVFKPAKKEFLGKQSPGAEKIKKKIEQPRSAKDLSEEKVQDVYTIEYIIQNQCDKGPITGSASDPLNFQTICKECGTSFLCQEMFSLHRHYHTQKDELVPLICEECGLTFKDRCALVRHKHVHAREPKCKDHVRYECASCETFFPTPQKLRLHQCEDKDDKPYHCTLCRREFQLKCSIAKHMRNHSINGTWTCQECGKSFTEYRRWRCHQRCHLESFKCPECGLTFTHRSLMETHRSQHTKPLRSFLCPTCGKTFKYKNLLQEHEMTSTNEKPFCCPECDIQLADQPGSSDELP
ncbi:uncharacterized protein LOC144199763 [Stigmatopora nigra]